LFTRTQHVVLHEFQLFYVTKELCFSGIWGASRTAGEYWHSWRKGRQRTTGTPRITRTVRSTRSSRSSGVTRPEGITWSCGTYHVLFRNKLYPVMVKNVAFRLMSGESLTHDTLIVDNRRNLRNLAHGKH